MWYKLDIHTIYTPRIGGYVSPIFIQYAETGKGLRDLSHERWQWLAA